MPRGHGSTPAKIIATWHSHSFLDAHWILSRPLSNLVLHLGDLGRVHAPQAALLLVAVCHGLLNLLEAFVQAQVVPHRILPAGRSSFEVGKMFTVKKNKMFEDVFCKENKVDV